MDLKASCCCLTDEDIAKSMSDSSMRALRELKDLVGFFYSYCEITVKLLWDSLGTGITHDLSVLIASLQIFDAESTYGIKD